MRNKLIYLLIFSALPLISFGQSVLSDGNWYRLAVTEQGVYKIDRTLLSQTLGIDVQNLDPRTVKIYGHGGGGMLPQANDVFRYSDPPQNPIYAKGTSDGKMDESDYFLFYGNIADKKRIDTDGALDYQKNLYCDTTYYFLTHGGEPGARLATINDIGGSGVAVNSYQDYIVFEEDNYNILKSGREWFSFPYGTGSISIGESSTHSYTVPGIISPVDLDVKLIGGSEFLASFDLYFNGAFLEQIEVQAISSDTYSDRAFEYARNYEISNTGEDINFQIYFNKSSESGTSRGYLDYFIMRFDRELKLYGSQTIFRNERSSDEQVSYTIDAQGKSNVMVWNITNQETPQLQSINQSGSIVSFAATNKDTVDQVQEYIIFDPADISVRPTYIGRVANQNIKAQTAVDGVIVTAPQFLSEAERLAQFHREHDGLSVAVVTTRQVYNEFSTGMQDVTAIRDYLRYVWQQGGTLKYALLFGDASYDYKKRIKSQQNFVPVYESRESFHRLFSHSSDDYYGFFEDDEGFWYEGDQTSSGIPISGTDDPGTLEIGVGRLSVTNINEAEAVVDKIIRYATSKNTFGKWRTEFAYLADDGDRRDHMIQSDTLNNILVGSYPEYNSRKVFLDNFDQPKNNSPAMRRALIEKFADGMLILDYLGHGGDNELMQERVIEQNLIRELTNRHKLPLMVTATCQFGVYDDATTTCGAEYFLRNPNGGAIALITTTRAVYASTNLPVNKAFHRSVFDKIDGEYPRLGDVIRKTKNNSLRGPINRNFALLGDPMLRLNYPKNRIVFEELSEKVDTLSALEHVTLKGGVYVDSSKLESFNGVATVTVWDIPRKKITKGLDNPEGNGLKGEINDPHEYTEQDNALFRGEVSVRSGSFEVDFVVPKNSSYKYEHGRVMAYAFDEQTLTDASGASTNFVLGGTAKSETDKTPPEVSIYINEPAFSNGDVVGPSSMFIADVSDESGINISVNGFNQSLSLILNDTLQVLLNDFYTATMDDYKTGKIVYPLQNLSPGRYTGQLKVWDTHNNYTIKAVEFRVSDQPKLRLFHVMNYPNPVSTQGETTFAFEHDRPGEGLRVDIAVYDVMGNKVNTWKYDIDDAETKVDGLVQSTVSSVGDRLKNGIYFYRLQVTSTVDGASNQVINRLLINN